MNKRIINLGIFAHVDAGKTTLTEDLLFNTHNTAHPGRVDDGTATTDAMDLERKRGITIYETTISFRYQDLQINLLDTPGHPDFIAEVERSLQVIDCAILVISGIEGIQAQTKKLFSILQRHHTPMMIFVNKVDRLGFDYNKMIETLKEQLTSQLLMMQNKQFQPVCYNEALLEFDDTLLERYINEKLIHSEDYDASYLSLLNQGKVYPVFFGSALRHLHTAILVSHLKDFDPPRSTDLPYPSAYVYKIKYFHRHRYTFFKVFSGRISRKDHFHGHTIRRLAHLELNQFCDCSQIETNDIGILIDDTNYHVGQWIGQAALQNRELSFQPNLSTSVIIDPAVDRQSIITRLMEMNDEDPYLEFSIMPDGTLTLKLFGEIQKEVIQSQIPVTFSDSKIIYQETILNKKTYTINIHDKINPWSAGLSVSCQPLQEGSGLQYQSKVDFGYLKAPFQSAVEESIRQAAKEGLYGWQITDVLVTLEDADFDSVSSTPADYRNLAPLVFMQAFIQGEVVLLSPTDRFELTFPYDHLSDIYYTIYTFDGLMTQEHYLENSYAISGMIPTANTSHLAAEITRITKGNGLYFSQYLCHQKTDKIVNNPYRLLPDATQINKYLLQKSQRFK